MYTLFLLYLKCFVQKQDLIINSLGWQPDTGDAALLTGGSGRLNRLSSTVLYPVDYILVDTSPRVGEYHSKWVPNSKGTGAKISVLVTIL